MLAGNRQVRPLSAFSGLTLLLVVAMAYQVGGAALPGESPSHFGHRVVQELPAIAQAQIAKRSEREDKRTPAVCGVCAKAGHAVAACPQGVAPQVMATRRLLVSELDLPPPTSA